jgi:hypothetical protein
VPPYGYDPCCKAFAHTRNSDHADGDLVSTDPHAFAPHCDADCYAGALHPDGSPESNGDSHSTINGYGDAGFVGYSAPNIDRND